MVSVVVVADTRAVLGPDLGAAAVAAVFAMMCLLTRLADGDRTALCIGCRRGRAVKVQRFVPIEHRCSAVLHRDIAPRSHTLPQAVAWLVRLRRAKRAYGCSQDSAQAVHESRAAIFMPIAVAGLSGMAIASF